MTSVFHESLSMSWSTHITPIRCYIHKIVTGRTMFNWKLFLPLTMFMCCSKLRFCPQPLCLRISTRENFPSHLSRLRSNHQKQNFTFFLRSIRATESVFGYHMAHHEKKKDILEKKIFTHFTAVKTVPLLPPLMPPGAKIDLSIFTDLWKKNKL